MKWLTFKIQKKPGFRLNLIDISLLLLLCLISYLLYVYLPERNFYFFPLYVGLTFFLFCNVFRIGNRVEPIWYVHFTLAMLYSLYQMEVNWPLILIIFVPLELVLIMYRIIRGPYLGILYEKVGKYDKTRVRE